MGEICGVAANNSKPFAGIYHMSPSLMWKRAKPVTWKKKKKKYFAMKKPLLVWNF